ncbi:MAG: EscU/YscU/HrcU family type III secretion system export apparatus switch protein, partial [Novosphingobium sp.]
GPVFSTTPLKPDFNRINPVSGFKRLFSFRMLVEALKATLKLGVYAVIAWLVISGMLAGKAAALTDSAQLATLLGAAVQRLLMFFALAALAFALIDQIYVRRDFARRMRMSRRELKREHRDREGEPRQKRKRRQLHGELAKAVSALRDVRGSDMIVINPVHYAVALRYDAGRMAAPSVTARGAGEMARRIKRIGFVYGVVMVNDPSLARALYRGGAIGSEIPPGLYAPVAAHYRRNGLGRKAAP